ncbi:DUF4112 domain-containing protein [Kozakia baliensis]|uniref:DUF4112 domain-containing protein n=1 Tax=Kozakia baliensis TaxID=153496 RepID=UPI000495A0F6|nr:DUF4112 domain-containing protein [Kozakia baliensis]
MQHGSIYPDEILPPGAEMAAFRRRLERIRKLAWWLNGAFRIPGIRTRFGLDTFLTLIPGGGDAVQAIISLYIVWEAHRMGVPKSIIRKMLVNVGIEAAVGVVPIAGDLFDTVFKADLRNIALIDTYLSGKK